MITRNPTEVASCGCPYDPEYDEGSLGWHLRENHPENELLFDEVICVVMWDEAHVIPAGVYLEE